MRSPRVIPAVLLAFGACTALVGCPTLPEAVPCGQIPAGGCPSGRGGTCEDPTCAGLWDCNDGKWVNVQTCAAPDAGPGGAGGGGPMIDGGPCTPVNIPTTGQTTDCTPDLQEPDCPVEAAETCAEQACLTGCADFFLCTKDGWNQVAYCDDITGQLVITAGP